MNIPMALLPIAIAAILIGLSNADCSPSITAVEFASSFPASTPAGTIDANYMALSDAMCHLGLESTFTNEYQKAAFLGSIAHNTANLSSHEAVCARDEFDSDVCDPSYDSWDCPWRGAFSEAAPGEHYFPRGALMLTFPCNYARLQDFIESNAISPAYIPAFSVLEDPSQVSDDLEISYMSALLVWLEEDGAGNSCNDYTNGSFMDFRKCVRWTSPWECSTDAKEVAVQSKRIDAVVFAGNNLGTEEDMIPMCSRSRHGRRGGHRRHRKRCMATQSEGESSGEAEVIADANLDANADAEPTSMSPVLSTFAALVLPAIAVMFL